MVELIVTCSIAGVIFLGCVGYIVCAVVTLPKKKEEEIDFDLDTLIIDLNDKS
ncbi:MAG: hypothetical protein IJF72_00350 [Clostridia bacterium]|nr:hypothetical protein [Clostridia bacterium]